MAASGRRIRRFGIRFSSIIKNATEPAVIGKVSPIYFNRVDSRLFGLLIFLNTTQHKFIDIHTTSAPLSRGKLFDGPYDPAGSGLRLLGRFDPPDPIPTTHGREVVPQHLRLMRSCKGDPEIGGGRRGGVLVPENQVFFVAPRGPPGP